MSILEKLKLEKWWNDKVPPVLALTYYLLAVEPQNHSPAAAPLTIAAFLAAIIGVAGFGHVVNDLFDVEQDRVSGKPNSLQGMSAGARVTLVATLLVVASCPWLYLPAHPLNLSLLGAEVVLLLCYASPPVRLKERGVLGALADALYAYTIPMLITLATFGAPGGRVGREAVWLAIVLAPWSLLVGLRGILHHQVLDLENDARSGTSTLVRDVGAGTTIRFLSRLLVPAEAAFFVLVVIAFSLRSTAFLLAVLLFAIWKLSRSGLRPDTRRASSAQGFVEHYGYALLGDFYTRWLPLATLCALLAVRPGYAALAVIHLALFRNGLVDLMRYELAYKLPAWLRFRGRGA